MGLSHIGHHYYPLLGSWPLLAKIHCSPLPPWSSLITKPSLPRLQASFATRSGFLFSLSAPQAHRLAVPRAPLSFLFFSFCALNGSQRCEVRSNSSFCRCIMDGTELFVCCIEQSLLAGLQYHEIKWAPGASMGQPGTATLLAASEKPYIAAFSVL
eukprot:scaffold99633_cov18-Tisochrysis_lutea.AAC.2